MNAYDHIAKELDGVLSATPKPKSGQPGSVQRIVSWRVWHVGDQRWCWIGRNFETRAKADRYCIDVTRGKRDAMTNYWRICKRVVAVLADGSSPMRDAAQREWDRKGVPARKAS